MASFRVARLVPIVGLFYAAPSAADDFGRDLVAIARAGVRPPECGGAVTGSARRWERAEEPRLGPYCDALARGYTRLRSSPKEALEYAEVADRAFPGRVPPLLLEARARASLGAYAEAWTKFDAVRARGISVDAPSVLHAMAVSALRTGHVAPALESFRALVSRIDFLDDAAEQLRILIEASVLAMSQGPDHVPEAVGYLTEAQRRPRLPGLSDYVLAALAVALDRQGLTAEANDVAGEATGPWRLESDRDRMGKAPELPELPGAEMDAMIAILADRRDKDLSLERWQSYLESDAGRAGPYHEWAERRRAAAAGKAPRKRGAP